MYFLLLFLAFANAACKINKINERKSNKTAKDQPSGLESLSEKDYIAFQQSFFEGLKQKMIGNLPEAVDHLNQSLQYYPRSAASMYEIAKIYDYKNNTDIAVSLLEKANEIEPTNTWYASTLAELYTKQRNFKGQEKVIRALIANEPNNLEYQFELANSLIYQGKYKDALKVYDAMESQIGTNEEFAMRKNKLYLGLKDFDGALKEIQKLLNQNPNEVRYLSMLAEMYQKSGKSKEAMETYEKIKSLDPHNPYVQLSLADYYEKAGERQKSIKILEEAFRNPEMSIDSKMQILVNYFTVTEKDKEARKEAIRLAEVTVEAHPEEAKARAMYGDYLYRENENEKAAEQYREALKLDKNHFMVWSQLMFIYSETEAFDSMATGSAAAIELFPLQPTFYFFNGVANIQIKNFAQAIVSLNEGKDLVIDNNLLKGQFYANLGEAYYRNKQSAKAYEAFDKCLEFEPDNLVISNNYAYYLSLDGIDLEKAEKMSRKTIEKEPNSATYLDTYAWILYGLKRYDEAEIKLRKALDNGGLNSAVVIEHYGDVLFKLSRIEEALKYWKLANETGKGSDFLEEKILKKNLIE